MKSYFCFKVVSREKMWEQNERGETNAGRVVNNAIFLLTRIFLKEKRTSLLHLQKSFLLI